MNFGPRDVHTSSEKFEEATAFFIRLGLQSTLIRHQYPPFRKRCSNQRPCVLVWIENILKWRSFPKTMMPLYSCDSPAWGFLKHKLKEGNAAFSNFSSIAWTENIWSVYTGPDKFFHGQKLAGFHHALTRDRRNWKNIWTGKCASLGIWKIAGPKLAH